MLKQYDLAIADYDQAFEVGAQVHLGLQNRGWLLDFMRRRSASYPAAAVESSMACASFPVRDLSDTNLIGAAHAAKGDYETAIGMAGKSG